MNQKLEYLLGKGKRGFDRRKLNKMFSQIVHLYPSIRLGLKYIYIYIGSLKFLYLPHIIGGNYVG